MNDTPDEVPNNPRDRLIAAAADVKYFETYVQELDSVLSNNMTDLNRVRAKLHEATVAFDAALADLKAVE